MTTLTHPAPVRALSPLRFLFALTARQATLDGPSLENDLQLESLQEHREQLHQVSEHARSTEGGLVVLQGRIRAAQAPGSPGGTAITPAEARPILRQLATLHTEATTTTRQLEELV